jgi:hypothetical protein
MKTKTKVCGDSVKASRGRIDALIHELCDVIVCLPVDDRFDPAVAELVVAVEQLGRADRILARPALMVVKT